MEEEKLDQRLVELVEKARRDGKLNLLFKTDSAHMWLKIEPCPICGKKAPSWPPGGWVLIMELITHMVDEHKYTPNALLMQLYNAKSDEEKTLARMYIKMFGTIAGFAG